MDRRDFLGTAAAVTATAAYGSVAPLPRRLYKDNIDLSIIAFGGIVVWWSFAGGGLAPRRRSVRPGRELLRLRPVVSTDLK